MWHRPCCATALGHDVNVLLTRFIHSFARSVVPAPRAFGVAGWAGMTADERHALVGPLADFDSLGQTVNGFDAASELRLLDAILRLEPTWEEAASIVRAVGARLEPSEMPPAVGDIVLTPTGEVIFAPGGMADTDVAIQAMARLLTRLLGESICPLQLWDAAERAQLAPMTFGSARGFGEALTCVLAHRGPKCLAAYVRHVKAVRAVPRRPVRRAFEWAG